MSEATNEELRILNDEINALRTQLAEVTAERDRMKAAIVAYNEARRKWMAEGDGSVQQEVDAWKKMEAALTAPEKHDINCASHYAEPTTGPYPCNCGAEKRVSDEWEKRWIKETGTKILDPDGWDRTNFEESWSFEAITWEEFQRRAIRSTCVPVSGTFFKDEAAPEKREVCRWRKINDGREGNWVGHSGEGVFLSGLYKKSPVGTNCCICHLPIVEEKDPPFDPGREIGGTD